MKLPDSRNIVMAAAIRPEPKWKAAGHCGALNRKYANTAKNVSVMIASAERKNSMLFSAPESFSVNELSPELL